jgi:HSP20 family molecular chaperone IbpA
MPRRFGFGRFKSAAEKFFSPNLGEPEYPKPEEIVQTPTPMPFLPPQANLEEGSLAIDVHHTPQEVVLTAPIAGVRPEDIEVSITEDVLTIKGKRVKNEDIPPENVLVNECFWGNFSRSYPLPFKVLAEKTTAQVKDGVLIIKLPKADAIKTQVIKVKSS